MPYSRSHRSIPRRRPVPPVLPARSILACTNPITSKTDLSIRRIVGNLAGTDVVFLEFLVKADQLQVRSRQWHHFFHSEGMSSSYHALGLDWGSAKLFICWFNNEPVGRWLLSLITSRGQHWMYEPRWSWGKYKQQQCQQKGSQPYKRCKFGLALHCTEPPFRKWCVFEAIPNCTVCTAVWCVYIPSSADLAPLSELSHPLSALQPWWCSSPHLYICWPAFNASHIPMPPLCQPSG